MTTKNDGGYAFPQPAVVDNDGAYWMPDEKSDKYAGMTIRDYFAEGAMRGLLANVELAKILGDFKVGSKDIPDFVAGKSYEMADAMIAERNK